jgi:hypothetical protein
VAYAVAVDSGNAQAIKTTGRPKFSGGFGRITNQDVDKILAVVTKDGTITKDEEEALLIILGTKANWGDGASKKYMIAQLEKNFKIFWSVKPIDKDQAALLLIQTNQIDFVSAGNSHAGTQLHYTSKEYQTIVQLIAQHKITAWEVSGERFYRKIPGAVDEGIFDSTLKEIYLLRGISATERKALFARLATKAIQNSRNGSGAEKDRHADLVIVRAFVALSLGDPYDDSGDDPLAVATRKGGAADLLTTRVASRNGQWKSKFKDAYDDVVEALRVLQEHRNGRS